MGEVLRRRSNGEGSVYRDRRGHWVAEVVIGGRRVRRTAKTKTEARRRMDEAKATAARGLPVGNHSVTVGAFLAVWVGRLGGTVAPRTEQSYAHVVASYITPRIGKRRLAALTPGQVTEMLADMEAAGYSANTRRLARVTLGRALRSAEIEGMVARNVARLAPGPRLDRKEGRTLTPTEARTLLEAARSDRLEAAWVVMLTCGLRRCEMLGLSWSDLDLGARTLTVRQSLVRAKGQLILGDTKTAGSRRTVFLPVEVVEVLRRHRVRQFAERLAIGECWRESGLVITSEIGTPYDPDNFRRRLSTLTRGAGLGHWSTHELRHSAASLMLAQGLSLKVVSETLGHSQISITADIYGHLLEPARREAAEAMGRVLWGLGG